jgi:two-component system, OmpR family, copper resistance phosphate regulon response regulator CusR
VKTEGQTQSIATPQLLIVEDDLPLANFLQKRLQSESYKVHTATDGEAAIETVTQNRCHLLILDLNLPKLDGFSVLKQLRPKQPRLPILVLTARALVEDRVLALDSGADDCLIKPFSFAELLARVRALLRRQPWMPATRLQVGDLMLDGKEFRVERGNRRIDLSTKEFALLEYLMRNAGQTVTRAMIMEHVWNMPFDATTNLVDVYVKYVRDKVDTQEFPLRLIRTIRGVGYVLADN